MNNSRWQAVTLTGETALAAIAEHSTETLLTFDFDGTLARIVPRAQDARLYEPSRDLLMRIGSRLGRLAIITGRAIDTVNQLGKLSELCAVTQLIVYGQYGAESWDSATGNYHCPPDAPNVGLAIAELQQLIASAPTEGQDNTGIVLEDKGLAVTMHYRQNPNPVKTKAWLNEPVAKIAARHELIIEPGRSVIELRASSVNKGDAMTELLTDYRPKVVFMFGDDIGDIPAFKTCHQARQQGLVAVNVISDSAESQDLTQFADIICDGPEGVADFLRTIAAALGV